MSAKAYMSSHGNLCYVGQSYGSVDPDKFLLVVSNTLLTKPEFNALVAVWCGRTEHDAYHDT